MSVILSLVLGLLFFLSPLRAIAEEGAGEDVISHGSDLSDSPAVTVTKDGAGVEPQDKDDLSYEDEDEDEIDEDELAKRRAAAKLAAKQEKHQKIISAALRQMLEGEPEVSIKAGIALAEVAQPSDIPTLIGALDQTRRTEVQVSIVETLGRLGDSRVAGRLRFELEHGKPPVAAAAVDALGYLGGRVVTNLLGHHLTANNNRALQVRMAAALGRIGGEHAAYTLKNSLESVRELSVIRAIQLALRYAHGEIRENTAHQSVPPGRKLMLNYYGLPYFTYHPSFRRKNRPKPRLLVCVHDRDYDAQALSQLCFKAAKSLQLAVIIPVFHPVLFPDYGSFNIRGKRADTHLLSLIEFAAKKMDVSTREIYMFGYGTGGEFVQRFSMAYPAKIARAAFYAREFSLATYESYFPNGLKTNPRAPNLSFDIFRFLKTNVAVIYPSKSGSGQAEKFLASLANIAVQEGVSSSIAIRKPRFTELESTWNIGSQFLFSRN